MPQYIDLKIYSRMHGLWTHLRQHYRPVQPTVTAMDGPVVYTELLPDHRLRDIIYCYWQLQTTQPLARSFHYKVVADGCMDIFFEPGQPGESFVMGFCKQYTDFPLGHSFNYVGIRFLPAMFPQLFGIPADVLSNRFESLDQVLPDVAAWINAGFTTLSAMPEIKARLDGYFLQRAMGARFQQDVRVYEAILRILEQKGNLPVETGLDTGLSPRQLRRLFAYYIGDSPKTFGKVVRFQHLLHAQPTAQSLRAEKLFFDAGYYDQAHFIKDFKHLYGITPAKAFGR